MRNGTMVPNLIEIPAVDPLTADGAFMYAATAEGRSGCTGLDAFAVFRLVVDHAHLTRGRCYLLHESRRCARP